MTKPSELKCQRDFLNRKHDLAKSCYQLWIKSATRVTKDSRDFGLDSGISVSVDFFEILSPSEPIIRALIEKQN